MRQAMRLVGWVGMGVVLAGLAGAGAEPPGAGHADWFTRSARQFGLGVGLTAVAVIPVSCAYAARAFRSDPVQTYTNTTYMYVSIYCLAMLVLVLGEAVPGWRGSAYLAPAHLLAGLLGGGIVLAGPGLIWELNRSPALRAATLAGRLADTQEDLAAARARLVAGSEGVTREVTVLRDLDSYEEWLAHHTASLDRLAAEARRLREGQGGPET